MSRGSVHGFVPDAFRRARESAGMSRGDLVRLARIRSDSTLSRWESGAVSPQVDVLRRALEAITEHGGQVVIEEILVIDPETRSLADWRHLRLLTTTELAGRAGLSARRVHQLERGQQVLTEDDADALAGALGIGSVEVTAAWEIARDRPPGSPA